MPALMLIPVFNSALQPRLKEQEQGTDTSRAQTANAERGRRAQRCRHTQQPGERLCPGITHPARGRVKFKVTCTHIPALINGPYSQAGS